MEYALLSVDPCRFPWTGLRLTLEQLSITAVGAMVFEISCLPNLSIGAIALPTLSLRSRVVLARRLAKIEVRGHVPLPLIRAALDARRLSLARHRLRSH